MQIHQYESPSLGEFIIRLQNTISVDGHRLSDREICRRAHLSRTTYVRVKRGSTSIYTPIMP